MTFDLDLLERLHAAATKGPWIAKNRNVTTEPHHSVWGRSLHENGIVCRPIVIDFNDAAYVAALHNAFPSLLSELRALREVERAAERATDCYFDLYNDNYGKGEKGSGMKGSELEAMNALSDKLTAARQR